MWLVEEKPTTACSFLLNTYQGGVFKFMWLVEENTNHGV